LFTPHCLCHQAV